jgi:lysozyme
MPATAETTAGLGTAMLFVDLSGNNWPSINSRRHFERLRAARVRGALIKATEGATFVNERFRAYRRWALDVGMLVGPYHFAYPTGGDAEDEAEHFIRIVGRLNQLRPVLDMEIDPGELRTRLTPWSRSWNRVVVAALGSGPLFYSYPYFIRYMRPRTPIGYGLWLASYGPNDGKRHPYVVPAPWKNAVLHQYTSLGRIGGVYPIDLNYAAKLQPLLAAPAV